MSELVLLALVIPEASNTFIGGKMPGLETSEWVTHLGEELEKQTGRKDIEIITPPYARYDVVISCAADKHPIATFYSAIYDDPQRIAVALDYAVKMLSNWDVTQVLHEKMKQDCLPFYEKLKARFTHLEMIFNVVDFDRHYVLAEKTPDRIKVSFDLWPEMTEDDIERLTFYIRDCEATLLREKATQGGVEYYWKC